MKHLYFCRHGQSEMNVAGKWAGSIETPLTPEGRKQAREAGQVAKGLGIDYIICSPLSRARDTANIIANEIGYPLDKIDVNSLVVERHHGALEGQPWQPDFNIDGIRDVETTDTVLERVRLMFEHLETIDAAVILIVSHGGFGRVTRHFLHPEIPYRDLERFENAKIVKLI